MSSATSPPINPQFLTYSLLARKPLPFVNLDVFCRVAKTLRELPGRGEQADISLLWLPKYPETFDYLKSSRRARKA